MVSKDIWGLVGVAMVHWKFVSCGAGHDQSGGDVTLFRRSAKRRRRKNTKQEKQMNMTLTDAPRPRNQMPPCARP